MKPRSVAILLIAILASAACAPRGEALYARAEQALDKGDARAAVIDLKNLVESEPQNARTRALLARALVQSGDVQAGAIELQKAKDLGAPPEMILVPECRVLISQGYFDKVLAQCNPENAPSGAKFELQIVQGRALMGLGRAADAKGPLQAAFLAHPDSLEALVGLASATNATDGLAAAKAVLARAPAAAREQTAYWMAVGAIDMDGADLEGAERAFATAVTYAEKASDNGARVMALGALAEAQLRRGKTREAMATGEQLMKAAPANPLVKQLRAQVLVAGGDLDQARTLLEDVVAAVPDNYQAEAALGMVNLKQGNLGQAEQHLSNVVAHQPNNVQAQQLLAEVRARLQTPAETLEAIELKPNDPTALLNLGRLDLAEGKTADAEQAFRKVLETDPKNTVATIGLGATSSAKGDSKEAEKWLQKAAADHPDSIDAQLTLAQFYINTRDFGKARTVLDAAAKRSPRDAAVSNARGTALLGLKDLPGAQASFKQATEQAPDASGYALNLARAYLAGGDLASALDVANGILKKDPGYVPALAFAAAACLVQGGDLEKAAGYVERLRQAAPVAPGTYALEGDLAMAQKRYREALDDYRKASARGANSVLVIAQYRAATQAGAPHPEKVLEDWVAVHPEDGAALMVLAEARQRKGDLDGAARLYEQVLLKSPGNPVLLNNLAVLYQAKGNPKALELAEKAYKAAPKLPAIQDTYGWILFNNGRTGEAAVLLAEAAKGLPDNAEVLYHYASVLVKQGKSAEAAELLKKAVKGPLPPDAQADARKLLQQVSR